MSLLLPMMMFINLFCCCSLVCFIAAHEFMLLFISLFCGWSLIGFVIVHEFVFANAVVH